jgi:hypothetical protein
VAKVYLSYTHADAQFANALAASLRAKNHEPVSDESALTPGSEWRELLTTALTKADAFVPVLTEHSTGSQFVLSEIGAARVIARSSGDMVVIPVVLGQIDVPNVVADLQAIISEDADVEHIAAQIDRAVVAHVARRTVRQQQQEAKSAQEEKDVGEYVEVAIASLRRNETRERLVGSLWFILGIIALIGGVVFGIEALSRAGDVVPKTAAEVSAAWVGFAWAALKSLVIIGLILAAVKYCFVLGRAHMSEALKSSDRIHAISYGSFYLRAFRGTEAPAAIKEVFQHWNITTPSVFASSEVEQFDPKYLEKIIEVVKSGIGKGG